MKVISPVQFPRWLLLAGLLGLRMVASAAAEPTDLLSPGATILDVTDPTALPTSPGPQHLYRLPVAAAFSPYGQSADTWLGVGQFDYGELDQGVADLLQKDPAARVLLRVEFDSPPWWEAQHPEALVPAPKAAPDHMAERKLTHASWYSAAWREAARQALRSLVQHVVASGYAASIAGYELDAGRAGRWVPWHQAAQFQETSLPAQVAFRQWLQKRYGSLAALRVAWGQPRNPDLGAPEVKEGYILTQWAQIKVPALAYLLDPKSPTLYDPSGQQHLADYQLFLGEYTADVILDLVKTGREGGGATKLWGTCYGHLLWWPEGDWPPSLAGHLGLGKLLAAEEISFLVGPAGAPTRPTSAVSSIRLRGKAYLEQPADKPGTLVVAQSRSDLAEFDNGPRGKSPASPWALVIDERSLSHLSPGADLQRVTLQTQAAELQKLGWPDMWLAGDLPTAPRSYGGYLMAATYFVPEELREAMIRRAQPGTVTVWLYAAATLDEGFTDPSAIFRLTGLKATLMNAAGSLRIEVPPGEPFFTPVSDQPLQWGPTLPVQPRFVLVTGEDTMGSMKGSPWPGLGLRWDKDALVVYSAAPGVPGEALERMREEARRRAGR